jgi:peptidoglycan/xylan/chitin deacetylase (PgdA/CDA1 family)
MALLGAAGAIVLALSATALFRPPVREAPPAPREVARGAPGKRMVALTFDAGGQASNLAEILTALKKANRRCTFFITGEWAAQHPALVQRIAQDRHEVGNHTWSHPDLTQLPEEEIHSELRRTEELLTRLTGTAPRPLWRAPFGARDERVLRTARSLGYTSIYWSLDSLDSVGEPKTSAFLFARVAGQPDASLDGAIVLMHVGEAGTAEALPAIMSDLRRRHFTVVPVSRLLALPRPAAISTLEY